MDKGADGTKDIAGEHEGFSHPELLSTVSVTDYSSLKQISPALISPERYRRTKQQSRFLQ